MSRLIWAPQFPTAMRYQQWFYREFKTAFEKEYDEVIILGKQWIHEMKIKQHSVLSGESEMFSPIGLAIELELHQIQEYMALELQDGDTLFHCDLSFPGIFHNILYHKRPSKAFVYCHGTSLNNMDYYERDRESKWNVELGNTLMYDKVFLATKYHQDKLMLDNSVVIGLPDTNSIITWRLPKDIEIASACRPTPQKVNIELEEEIQEGFNVIIQRANFSDWESYYKFLASSKMLLITASEETFGYTILDAIKNDCIPIAPNKYSYPELLPRKYLYDNEAELFELTNKVLNGEMEVPKLLNQAKIDYFYNSLISEMKEL